jgi:hypothetical protein
MRLFCEPGFFIIACVERQVNETFVLTEVHQFLVELLTSRRIRLYWYVRTSQRRADPVRSVGP